MSPGLSIGLPIPRLSLHSRYGHHNAQGEQSEESLHDCRKSLAGARTLHVNHCVYEAGLYKTPTTRGRIQGGSKRRMKEWKEEMEMARNSMRTHVARQVPVSDQTISVTSLFQIDHSRHHDSL